MNQIYFRSSRFTVGATVTVELQLRLVEPVRFRLIVRRNADSCGTVLVPDQIKYATANVEIDGDYVLAGPKTCSPLWVRYRNTDIERVEAVQIQIEWEPWTVIDRIAHLENG